MSLTTRLDPAAVEEWAEAFDWYEMKVPGRGSMFNAAVEQALDHIQRWPLLHPTVFEDVRMYAMPDYPYSIYYVVEENYIQILSVFHQRRNPRDWQQRR